MTQQLTQSQIVTLAVYLLGGDQQAVDTEDAAIKAHELAPGRFSWRKDPEQIHLELIRVYLSNAKEAHKGALVVGSGRTGVIADILLKPFKAVPIIEYIARHLQVYRAFAPEVAVGAHVVPLRRMIRLDRCSAIRSIQWLRRCRALLDRNSKRLAVN